MIENWAPKLTTILKGVAGIVKVHQYDDLPSTIAVSPMIVWMPTDGLSLTYGLSTPNIQIMQIQITLYVTAPLLPTGVGILVPFIDKIPRAIAAKMTLENTVNYIMPRMEGNAWEGPGDINYGEGQFTGVNFYYNVKENLDFEVSR